MRCIVSLANSRGNYHRALDRLESSVKQNNPEIAFIGHRSEGEIGAPQHIDNPYAFKVFAISQAVQKGYTSILWLDSSCYAIANLNPLFELIEQDGYAMQEAGVFAGKWCNDECLKYFDVTRERANEMLMYGNAGLLGLDFNKPIARSFFSAWQIAMVNGKFKGSWDNHRHDMSCGSIIANLKGMRYNIKGDSVLQYAAPNDPLNNDTVIIKAQGL